MGLLLAMIFERIFGELHRMPTHIDADRDFVFDGHGEEGWAIDFEVGTSKRNGAGNAYGGALRDALERHLSVMSGLAGELDFEIGVNPI